jgi:hypothetical protein
MKEKDGGNRSLAEFGRSTLTGGHAIFSRFRGVNSVAFCKKSQGGVRPMQRLIPIARIAALPAWLDRGSEWTWSVRFR